MGVEWKRLNQENQKRNPDKVIPEPTPEGQIEVAILVFQKWLIISNLLWSNLIGR